MYSEFGGQWELPGGKVEDNESLEEAMVREMGEETGLEASSIRHLVRVLVEDEQRVDCHIMLVIPEDDQEVETSSEHHNFAWVKPEDYKDLDWHVDAGYAIPVAENIEYYL